MKKITIYGTEYELDTRTAQGKDLYAAYQLVSMFGMPAIPEDELPIEAIVELREARIECSHPYNASYLAAVSLCGKYDAQVSHHIRYLAYKNLPASYRPQAIEALSKVLSYGNMPAFHIYQLGLKLAAEYRFDEAIAHIKTAINMEPHDPLYHVHLAEVLVKTNDIDAALQVLYDYQETEHYKKGVVQTYIGPQRMQHLDYTIQDIEAKKARGYVYRPRKKKPANNQDDEK